jgi:hypothetical protein
MPGDPAGNSHWDARHELNPDAIDAAPLTICWIAERAGARKALESLRWCSAERADGLQRKWEPPYFRPCDRGRHSASRRGPAFALALCLARWVRVSDSMGRGVWLDGSGCPTRWVGASGSMGPGVWLDGSGRLARWVRVSDPMGRGVWLNVPTEGPLLPARLRAASSRCEQLSRVANSRVGLRTVSSDCE